jgi:O-antigen/teichoic acid export membrane protein
MKNITGLVQAAYGRYRAKIRGSNVAKNFFLTGIGIGLFGISKVIFNTVVLKNFGEAAVGKYNLILSFPMLSAIIISNFSILSLSKFASESFGKKSDSEMKIVTTVLLLFSIFFSIFISIIFYIFSDAIARHFSGDPSLYRQSTVIILLYTLYSFFKSFSYVINKVQNYILFELAGFIVFIGILIYCTLNHLQDSLLLPIIFQLSMIILLGFVYSYQYVLIDIEKIQEFFQSAKVKEIFKYSMITGLGTTGSMSIVYLYTMVLSKYASIEDVGYYAAVASMLDPLNFLPRIITMVIFPRIAYYFGGGNIKKITSKIKNVDRYWFFAWGFMSIILLILMPKLSELLFSSHSNIILIFIDLMLISRIIGFLGIFQMSILSATKYPIIPNTVGPIALVVTLPFVPIAYQYLGLNGVGVLLIIGSLIKVLPVYYFSYKLMDKL